MKNLIIVVFLVLAGSAAEASENLKRAANLTAIAEASLATVELISDLDVGEIGRFSWSANYAESEWKLHVEGNVDGSRLEFALVGFLWGHNEGDWEINYSGSGDLGEEPLLIAGRAKWIFDREKASYSEMDFDQTMKIGENSIWLSIAGAEAIVGGTIGAGGAIVATSVATGGIGFGASLWVGAAGAGAGASALISASGTVKSFIEADQAPPPLERPPRPNQRENGTFEAPESSGFILTAVDISGRIRGTSIDGKLELDGMYKDGSNFASGTIIFRDR